VEPQESDRRRYFRIEDRVALHCQPVAGEALERLLHELADDQPSHTALPASFAATTVQMEHVLHRIKERDADVAGYLQTLNHKLDQLARAVVLEREDGRSLETVPAEISASGISFNSDGAFREGELVRVALLTQPGMALVVALGRVIRSRPGQDHFDTAIDFEQMRDGDRDLIVQHVMHRQAALLRGRRGGEGDGD
jgi:hypothetical protein